MISILFGLFSALCYGTSDFLGGLFSRRFGAYRVTFYAALFGFPILLVAAAIIPQTGLTGSEWIICFLAGVTGSIGLLSLYLAMAIGKLSIAAPLSALIAALLPVTAGLITDGFPGPVVMAGFVLALVAVWLITRSSSGEESDRFTLKDLRLPLIAGIGFGIYLILIHQASQHAVIWPMVGSRSAAILVLFIIAAFNRQLSLSQSFPWHLVLLSSVLDVGGNALYILAGQYGRMDVAAVLSSLFPGVTAILAWLILHEKINRSQAMGILAALGAIVLITI